MTLSVEVAAQSDVGCVRTNNEDAFGYNRDLGVFVVCDGMGGQAAGEVASRMAVETIRDYFQSAANGAGPVITRRVEGASERANALASAIEKANEAVFVAAEAEEARRGMGSTVACVLVDRNQPLFSIAHVGDSRIYLLHGGELQQLTNDHSLVMEQVRAGILTREEAEKSDMQNIIMRALGPEPTVKPDVDDLMAYENDQLLLATDGLTKNVPAERMQAILTNAPSLKAAAGQLVDAAKAAGGDDNITCILIRFQREPWYKQLLKGLRGGGSQWQSSC